MRKGNIQKNSTLKDYYGKDARRGAKAAVKRRNNAAKTA